MIAVWNMPALRRHERTRNLRTLGCPGKRPVVSPEQQEGPNDNI